MPLFKRTVSGEKPPPPPDWEKHIKRLPNGKVEMEVSDELLARLDKEKLPGEDYNDVIKRILAAQPKDGQFRRGFRQPKKGKR